MSLDDRMRNLFPFHSFSAHKSPRTALRSGGFFSLCEFFFYFGQCHFERMPA